MSELWPSAHDDEDTRALDDAMWSLYSTLSDEQLDGVQGDDVVALALMRTEETFSLLHIREIGGW